MRREPRQGEWDTSTGLAPDLDRKVVAVERSSRRVAVVVAVAGGIAALAAAGAYTATGSGVFVGAAIGAGLLAAVAGGLAARLEGPGGRWPARLGAVAAWIGVAFVLWASGLWVAVPFTLLMLRALR